MYKVMKKVVSIVLMLMLVGGMLGQTTMAKNNGNGNGNN
jgi:hypothetical protein